MKNALGYTRLGDLTNGTEFTVNTLKLKKDGTGFKTIKKQDWKLISTWVMPGDPKSMADEGYFEKFDELELNLMQCAPKLGGVYQTSQKAMQFLSINEMVIVH